MLAIVIVNWNTKDALEACLASIEANPPSGGWACVVVDNASSDGSADRVAERFPWAQLVRSQTNLGYAAGNNLGFSQVEASWYLTLNPDTEVGPGCLSKAVEILSEREVYGVLSCKFINMQGQIQSSIRDFPTAANMFGEMTGLAKLFPRSQFAGYRLSWFDYAQEGPAPQPMGTFLLFREDALAMVGDIAKPFDESFPIFFNEVDLLRRLKLAGWPCLYTPAISIRHHGGLSTKQVRKNMIWESHRSLIRYLDKHETSRDRRWLPCLKALLLFGAWVRARGVSEGFRP